MVRNFYRSDLPVLFMTRKNSTEFQCVKDSHIVGVPLRSRSLAKKGVHSHFHSLFSKGVRSLIALPKKQWHSFSPHLKTN